MQLKWGWNGDPDLHAQTQVVCLLIFVAETNKQKKNMEKIIKT